MDAWRGHIEDWMDDCLDFMDSAALIQNLDLVIAIDSAVAHLAGALGKPVWLLNRFGREWRWGLTSNELPGIRACAYSGNARDEGWEPVDCARGGRIGQHFRAVNRNRLPTLSYIFEQTAPEHACETMI